MRRPTESGRGGAGSGDALVDRLLAELPRLRRYAIALIGDLSTADDLLQDCIERALRRRGSLQSADRVGPWLRSILHNLYIDEIRQRRSRGTAVDVDELTNTLAFSVPARDRSSVRELTAAMNALSPEHRQVILLVTLEGLSYREVGEELGVPIGTVMSRVARAREQLRSRLDGSETGAPRSADCRQPSEGSAR
jgi:RNA polymerase sigma-70 factor (ECF subfamily)